MSIELETVIPALDYTVSGTAFLLRRCCRCCRCHRGCGSALSCISCALCRACRTGSRIGCTLGRIGRTLCRTRSCVGSWRCCRCPCGGCSRSGGGGGWRGGGFSRRRSASSRCGFSRSRCRFRRSSAFSCWLFGGRLAGGLFLMLAACRQAHRKYAGKQNRLVHRCWLLSVSVGLKMEVSNDCSPSAVLYA